MQRDTTGLKFIKHAKQHYISSKDKYIEVCMGLKTIRFKIVVVSGGKGAHMTTAGHRGLL